MAPARPRSLHEKLKIVAAREGVSLNACLANVLAERVGQLQKFGSRP